MITPQDNTHKRPSIKSLGDMIDNQQTENSVNEGETTGQHTDTTATNEQQPTSEMAPISEREPQEAQSVIQEWSSIISQCISPAQPSLNNQQEIPQLPFPSLNQPPLTDLQAAYWNYTAMPVTNQQNMPVAPEQQSALEQYSSQQYWQPQQYSPQQYWQPEQYPPEQYWQPAQQYMHTGTTGVMTPIMPPVINTGQVQPFQSPPVHAQAGSPPTHRPLKPRRKKGKQLTIIVAICNIILIALAFTVARFLLIRNTTSHLVTEHVHGAATAGPAVLNTITNNTTISPLIFGTNMALYQNGDEPLINSPQVRQTLQNIGVRIIRMPTRATLSDQTEIQAAEAIKAIGAVPLVVINGPEFHAGAILQSDEHLLYLINSVFGTQTVYYEFGNESDLQGITVQQYIQAWNQVIPQLKHNFPNARFIGPSSYQFSWDYIKTFVQEARPLPDGISWHEYTCSIQWTAQFCLDNINAWTTHITQAREAMQQVLGTALPIWITEWNYASDTNDQFVKDGKANNPAFMQEWTLKAMQTLIANRVFASMQYFATSNPMPLVTSNNQLGIEGKVFQQEYEQVMVHGYTPPVATITYPRPTSTVNPNEAFSFENGSTGGWTSIGAGITQPLNTTAAAFDGTHSLMVTLDPASTSDTPFISISGNQLASPPRAGQMLSAYIYVANKEAIINAKIFVANAQHNWLFANSFTLTSGQWNHIWYALPMNFSNDTSQVGIQFFSSTPGVSTPVYIDTINWQ